MKYLYTILICISLLTAFHSCAKYGVPGGGPDDEIAPTILWSESDENFQTNFSNRSIQLVFDEWVSLSNPTKEIVISPPLVKPLSATIKGKSVVIEIAEDEILKPDVTYQINFGDAIRDFTAGNILKNCVFVFSTGDRIDSLSIGGNVYDELSKQAVGDVLVMLYEDKTDSVLLNQKPFYFTKTDSDGSFRLQNLRSDSFQIYALLDENVSYTYDLPGEQIAYYDKMIHTNDTLDQHIKLYLFDEDDPPRLVDYRHDVLGLVKVKYENLPQSYSVQTTVDSAKIFHELVSDSLYIWFDPMKSDSIDFVIDYAEKKDTLSYKQARNNYKEKKLQFANPRQGRLIFHHNDSLILEMNRPLKNIDTSLIMIKDSSDLPLEYNSGIMGRSLWLEGLFKNNASYTLFLHPNALTDWYGNTISDSLIISCNTYDSEKFGSISAKISGVEETQYILDLMDKDKRIATRILKNNDIIVFEKLKSSTYSFKITEDLNRDGRWNSGRFLDRKKSERIGELQLETLKEGWELEVELNIKELFDGT